MTKIKIRFPLAHQRLTILLHLNTLKGKTKQKQKSACDYLFQARDRIPSVQSLAVRKVTCISHPTGTSRLFQGS